MQCFSAFNLHPAGQLPDDPVLVIHRHAFVQPGPLACVEFGVKLRQRIPFGGVDPKYNYITEEDLIHRGYVCGGRTFLGKETPDGDFGPVTEKAVRDFQTKADLEPDGEIGADTWTALLIS